MQNSDASRAFFELYQTSNNQAIIAVVYLRVFQPFLS